MIDLACCDQKLEKMILPSYENSLHGIVSTVMMRASASQSAPYSCQVNSLLALCSVTVLSRDAVSDSLVAGSVATVFTTQQTKNDGVIHTVHRWMRVMSADQHVSRF